MADANEKKYLDLSGLTSYDAKIKALIDSKDAVALKAAKDYADGLATNYDAAGTAAGVQSNLDAEIERAKKAEEANAAAAAAAQTKAEQGVADAAAAKTAADAADAKAVAAQKDVDDLEAFVGSIPEGDGSETVIAYVDKKTAGIASDAALTSLAGRVTTAEGEIDTLQTDVDAVEAKAAANETAIAKLNGEGDGSVKKQIDDAFNDFATKVSDDNVVNTYKELIDYCATHSAEAAEMAGDIADNATAISNLEKFVGELPEGTSATDVIAYINEKVAAEQGRAEKAEGALDTRVKAVEAKLGEGEDSVSAQIAAAVKVETDARTAADNTLDGKVATAQSAAEAAQGDVDALETVVAGKAAQTDLDAVSGRVTTAEGKITTLEGASHAHDNKAVIDAITAQKVAAWDGAVNSEHTHTNKAVLDGITAAKIAAWDGAEANAKAYTDTKIAEFVPVSTDDINGLFPTA